MNPRSHRLASRASSGRRLFGFAFFLVFVVGVLLLPAWHELTGGGNKGHCHESCPTCQVAHIPMDVVVPATMPALADLRIEDPGSVPPAMVLPSLQRDPTQARAPPVC